MASMGRSILLSSVLTLGLLFGGFGTVMAQTPDLVVTVDMYKVVSAYMNLPKIKELAAKSFSEDIAMKTTDPAAPPKRPTSAPGVAQLATTTTEVVTAENVQNEMMQGNKSMQGMMQQMLEMQKQKMELSNKRRKIMTEFVKEMTATLKTHLSEAMKKHGAHLMLNMSTKGNSDTYAEIMKAFYPKQDGTKGKYLPMNVGMPGNMQPGMSMGFGPPTMQKGGAGQPGGQMMGGPGMAPMPQGPPGFTPMGTTGTGGGMPGMGGGMPGMGGGMPGMPSMPGMGGGMPGANQNSDSPVVDLTSWLADPILFYHGKDITDEVIGMLESQK